jgi:uncharacterized membrane protein
MPADTILITHELLCLALLYSVFCRAAKSCEKVRADVRFAFFVLGIVACAGVAAPLAWGFIPDVFGLSLLAAMTTVQLVTAHHWKAGVPDRFYKPGCVPRGRRSCDVGGGCTK